VRDTIIAKLYKIEKEQQVKMLYAVESGSRAWGFESKDSDYDIRFIYAHPLDWYIGIQDKKDVIEYPLEKQLDFSGWDIRKALKLYKKPNPTIYEWLNSPIIYIENSNFAQTLRELTPQFYSPISSISHYLHMAEGNYREYLQGDIVRVKKYFYVLRPIFACMWIEQYKNPPPIEFIQFLNVLDLDSGLKMQIQNLLQRKKAGEELDREKKITIINDFLDAKIHYFRKYVREMKPTQTSQDISLLNKILHNIVTHA